MLTIREQNLINPQFNQTLHEFWQIWKVNNMLDTATLAKPKKLFYIDFTAHRIINLE